MKTSVVELNDGPSTRATRDDAAHSAHEVTPAPAAPPAGKAHEGHPAPRAKPATTPELAHDVRWAMAARTCQPWCATCATVS